MHRLERLYAVAEELRRRAPERVSARELAERFGVTRRTMERDLVALRDAGVPLYADQGRTGGYSVLSQPGRVVFNLSIKEVTALLIAVGAAERSPYTDAAQAATRRLLDALPAPTRLGVEWLGSRIRMTEDEWPLAARRAQATIEEAVRQNRVVNLHYLDADGARTERAVEPVGFFHGGAGWYLVGWCRLRQDRRLFRLDRVERAQLTTEVAQVRDVDETLGWIPSPSATVI